MESIIFMFCLTLHNVEEALWFTDWRIKNMPSRRTPKKQHFIFAVLGITVLGYLAAGLFALFPISQYFEYAFIGFTGAMLVNAIMPHFLLTIAKRKYCPGVFTGCFLIIPFHIMIIYKAISDHLKISEVVFSTVVVGLAILGFIPVFERIAKRIFDGN